MASDGHPPFPNHNPERLAAAYVAGAQKPRIRRRFEEHLLECEECWREVGLARTGRTIAESAREVAPAHLRESVRGAVALSGASSAARRPFRVGVLAVAATVSVAALALVGVVVFVGHGQPAPIAAALAAFHSDATPVGAPASQAAPDLGMAGLEVQASAHEMMGGFPVDAYAYRSSGGERILLLMSNEAFPQAQGAIVRSAPVTGWEAREGGVVIRCANRPHSYLLLGDDAHMLTMVERALNSTT